MTKSTKPPVAESEITSIRERLDAKTVRQGECEVWTGQTKDGYGRMSVKGKKCRTHRLTWEIEKGPIPEGLGVLHHCDNRPCRRLDHLFVGTPLQNNEDRHAKGRSRAGRRERHGSAILTEEAVKEIRQSTAPARVFAAKYCVTVETIRRCRRRNTWS